MTNVPVPGGDERSSWSLIWQVWVSLLVVAAVVIGVVAVTQDDSPSTGAGRLGGRGVLRGARAPRRR